MSRSQLLAFLTTSKHSVVALPSNTGQAEKAKTIELAKIAGRFAHRFQNITAAKI